MQALARFLVVLFSSLILAMTAAHAAVDVSAVTSGIGDAQTAILSVLGGLVALSVAIFGISKVYAFIKRKAGA
jgi:hypothetical protein